MQTLIPKPYNYTLYPKPLNPKPLNILSQKRLNPKPATAQVRMRKYMHECIVAQQQATQEPGFGVRYVGFFLVFRVLGFRVFGFKVGWLVSGLDKWVFFWCSGFWGLGFSGLRWVGWFRG